MGENPNKRNPLPRNRPTRLYEAKQNSLRTSFTAVEAAKIGSVPTGTTEEDLKTLFGHVSVGKSDHYTGEWRCTTWVRDATRLLVSKGQSFQWHECIHI